MEFNYDVFFSYRHRPLDGEITQKCFNVIEGYRLPKAIRAMGCPEIRRAFRDTEELPVSRILTDTIDKALHSTNCLVVVCSTDTPSSEWIDREVQTFIEIGRADHIYPLLISGDPESSFPPSLKLVPDAKERMMDIRAPGNNIKTRMAKAETELLRGISAIVGCREKELLREHRLRKSKRFAARALGAAAAFALVAGVSLGLMRLAQNYREEAQRREEASMFILNELTYDLPDRLTNVSGAYGRIAGILQRNTEDIQKILRLTRNREEGEMEAAANYEKLANANSVLGSYDDALLAEDTAIAIFQTLADAAYAPGNDSLPSAFNNRGIILNAAGRYAEAQEDYGKAIALQNEVKTPDTIRTALMYRNAGANAVDLGDEETAAEAFEKCLRLLEEVPEDDERLNAEGDACFNYGLLRYRNGQYAEAEILLDRAGEDRERLLRKTYSYLNLENYVKVKSALATCLMDAGLFETADEHFEKAIGAAEVLAGDGENVVYVRELAGLYLNHALAQNIRGLYTEADEEYGKAETRYSTLSEKTGSASDKARYALVRLNRGENAFKMGDMEQSRAYLEDGFAIYEEALPELGDYDLAQYDAWQSYFNLIHERDFEAALAWAMEGYDLQPDNVLVRLNLGYACLYAGERWDGEDLLEQVAALGGGQKETIRVDLEAQLRAGMPLERADELMEKLGLQ